MNRPSFEKSARPPYKREIVAFALVYTYAILALGYLVFGFITMLIFASGFFLGFLAWLLIKTDVSYSRLKIPYWVAFALFVIHRIEEKVLGFFPFLSEVTGVQIPAILSWKVITLVVLSVGGWLAIPYLIKRQNQLGYYFAWTFFCAMGITELAHWLVFPFLAGGPPRYLPGMVSVVFLAPVAWVGMKRMVRG